MNSQNISDDPAPDIQTLRQNLLEYVQLLSGHVWTDYNIHDPGVMVLEQIAYSITETEYRSTLPIIDRLASAHAACESNSRHLIPPEQVFCMQAVTVKDLEAVLSSAAPSVERVTVCPRKGKESGLYDIYVIPVTKSASVQACEAVEAAYLNYRNLCENAEVVAAKPVPCTLALTLEHHRRALPEQIVAECFSRCSDLLIGRPLPGTQISTDQAFADPSRLTPGWTDFEDRALNTSRLSSAVASIPDVIQVSDLRLLDFNNSTVMQISHIGTGEYFDLQLPDELTSITLTSRGRESTLDGDRIKHYLPQFKRDHKPYQSPAFPTSDNAVVMDSQRVPIAHELPVAYLAGQSIDSESLPERRRSSVRQFRSYLKLIDNMLDDMEISRSNMPDLYSDAIENLITETRTTSSGEINPSDLAVGPVLNPDINRKSRALDRLLGTFGEQFTQSSLKRFRDSADNEADMLVLSNKKRLLKALPEVAPTRCARKGFCEKLEILLDLPKNTSESKTPDFILIEDILLRCNSEFRAMELDIIFPSNTISDQKPGYRSFVIETVSIVCPAHILPRVYWLSLSQFNNLNQLLISWKDHRRAGDAAKIRSTLQSAKP